MVMVEFKKINLKAINDALALLFKVPAPESTTTEDPDVCNHRIKCAKIHKLENFISKKNDLNKTFVNKIGSIDDEIEREIEVIEIQEQINDELSNTIDQFEKLHENELLYF